MADSLDDGEFWLPPKFLNDEDLFMDFNTNNCAAANHVKNAGLRFAPLGSPVESLVCSSETESDEEEYIAGLTNRMARSSLDDVWGSSGSPQSTLCALGSGCGCKQGSSRGSPNGHSHAAHPQLTLDLLYAAAGEVSKMRMNQEEAYGFVNSRAPLAPHRKPTPVSVPLPNRDADAGVYQQLQASQFLHLRRQQLIEQMNFAAARLGQTQTQTKGAARNPPPQMPQNRGRSSSEFFNGGNCRPVFQPTWAPPRKPAANPPPNGSGMRAVFLGAPGGKRECAGTGVFLPRQAGAVPEPRKKPACSTVLVPARVMQALNLNLDDMYVQRIPPQQFQSRSPSVFNKNDVCIRARNECLTTQQKAANLWAAATAVPAVVNQHDIRLPQEWTY